MNPESAQCILTRFTAKRSEDKPVLLAEDSLGPWTHILHYIVENTYDIWIHIDILDVEPTYFALHLTVKHKYTHEAFGQHFYLYSILSVQGVAEVLCQHMKILLQRLLKRDNIDINPCKLLGTFPVEADVEHLEAIQKCIPLNCCL